MTRTLLRFFTVFLNLRLSSSGAGTSACSKTFIPNTDVEDTGVNREVIEFCETYRHALEDKNVPS